MKEYKKQYLMKKYKKHYNLGLKNKNENYKNYKINNKRHGYYYLLFSINNVKYTYKGFYNMGQEYGHWKDYYDPSIYRYFL